MASENESHVEQLRAELLAFVDLTCNSDAMTEGYAHMMLETIARIKELSDGVPPSVIPQITMMIGTEVGARLVEEFEACRTS